MNSTLSQLALHHVLTWTMYPCVYLDYVILVFTWTMYPCVYLDYVFLLNFM